MKKISIKEILSITNGNILNRDVNLKQIEKMHINDIALNSKECLPENLFLPIKGEKFDAHDFILEAFENGAVATLTENDKVLREDKIFIKVSSSVQALQEIAGFYRDRFNLPLIGVTGSVGKTSTKEMISTVLEQKFEVLKTQGNYNGQIGLPLTLLNLEPAHQVGVIEMGISEFDEMTKLVKIAKPKYAVMTNIGVTHIENLKLRENIFLEKLHIIDKLTKDSILFINGDDQFLSGIKATDYDFNIIKFGFGENCDFRAQSLKVFQDSTEFEVVYKNKKEKIHLNVVGKHHVYNALVAFAIALDFNIDIKKIKTGLESYLAPSMRQQIFKTTSGMTVIDDSYNANPDSMKTAIEVLCAVGQDTRKIAVLADMLELGVISEITHHDLGLFIAKECVDILVAVGPLAKLIVMGIKHVNTKIKTYICQDNDQANKVLNKILRNNDTVLLKGSRGMHIEQIVEKIKNM